MNQPELNRRRLLQALAVSGAGSALLRRILADEVSLTGAVTSEAVAQAEWITGLKLTGPEREATATAMESVTDELRQIRSVPMGYDSPPAFRFDPEMADPAGRVRSLRKPAWLASAPSVSTAAGPDDPGSTAEPADQDPAFLTIRQLGRMLRTRQISAVALARFFLDRLRAFDPLLNCVVTLTEELAMEQAQAADCDFHAGRDRGPLQGIPWGAKDLIAVTRYPTSWGAPQFRSRILPETAAVARRMADAGAVLIAKLSLGALAMGDHWYGGVTRNPWNPAQGSSGSSAGSAAAVAAGLLPVALGSETLGSIISPSRRCGTTALRPTFGRVSRHGCMPLSWTMDKIGPLARCIDDCGMVLGAVHGMDDLDPTTVDRWYEWPMAVDLSQIRVGQICNRDTTPADQIILELLRDRGAKIVPTELPDDLPEWSVTQMLDIEAAAIFQELLKAGDEEGLNQWPTTFRRSHFVSAVDYLQAARVRFELMKRMLRTFQDVDLYVGGDDLGITNLTGHPTVILPVASSHDTPPVQPLCGTITGRLYDESTLLATARIVEQAVHVNRVPPMFATSRPAPQPSDPDAR